ncbi:MAG: type I DNA topoisomerase, partial [bacterium]
SYTVEASVGHILDLPKREMGVDIENGFTPHYEVIEGKASVIESLRRHAQKAKEIFIATDPDREGEAIAAHVAKVIHAEEARVRRVLFNEITPDSIRRGLSEPGHIDQAKVEAQQARRILDRLVGYMVSPFLQKVVAKGLSAGRVQSVALRIICEREAEIRAFAAQEYWSITADLLTKRGESFQAKLALWQGKKVDMDIADEAAAQAIVGALQNETFTLTDLKKRDVKSSPLPPYTTSTLQQDAAHRLKFSNTKTMQIAQALYEGVEVGKEGPVGLITYMRTDSTRIAPEALSAVRTFVENHFGETYRPAKPRQFKKSKRAQDAHEAIRPTDVRRDPQSLKKELTPEQFRLYELIWKRFVASQMADAKYEVTTATIEAGAGQFRAVGRRTRFKGYQQVYEDLKSEEDETARELPVLEMGDTFELKALTPKQHFTQPPPRYNEGSLVKELDEKGIGRPSTYALIISTLIGRRYVTRKEHRFYPTELGEMVNKILTSQFPDIFNVSFTAKMEEELDSIENEDAPWAQVVEDFYRPFQQSLQEAKAKRQELRKQTQEITDQLCEKCGSAMVIRWGRHGRFLGCSAFPACKNIKPLEPAAAAQPTDKTCPKCGEPMVARNGKFGAFLGCSGYPKCKTILPLDDGRNVPCPKAGCDGTVSPKRSRKGRAFWGCSNYPKCDFVSWHRPLLEPCATCDHPYLEERSTKAGTFKVCPKCKAKVAVEA